ncbi:alpha-amylase family glycosyl hydrolase, partial [Cellulomonas septica]|uniref:alpha-amylase family glycosyl hydrolase n=1 Tax=Cellulomonas septica TaxID=285080 RepID=UPI0031B5B49B
MTQAHPQTDPTWWRDAVIYQVYPRSFADGNGDGTGDLAGLRARLPYLHDLGVDAIWVTPWYQSPLADGGYDVADYRAIDPAFGTLDEAEQVIAEALALGIRTIIDIVPNHVSEQHAWFRAALAAGPGSPERARFWFHPGKGEHGDVMPTNWVSDFQGTTWTRTTNPDGTPGEWYLHLFAPQQPDLNWSHPDVRAEFEDVLRFWFDRGVAGIRIDSAALLVKDGDLPEVPEQPGPGEHPHVDRDEIHDVYRAWRAVADSYEGTRVLVGEVWLQDKARFAQYLRPDEMHTAFNFDFMARPWDAKQLRESVDVTLAAHGPVGAPATWVLSNHDVTRPVTRYGREDSSFAFTAKRFGTPTDLALGRRRARAAALLTAAVLVIEHVPPGPLGPALAVVVLVGAVVVLLRRGRGRPHAVLPTDLVTRSEVAVLLLLGGATFAGLYAFVFLVPLSDQAAFGRSALATGVAFLPLTVALFAVGFVAGRLAERFPERLLVGGALLAMAAGTGL